MAGKSSALFLFVIVAISVNLAQCVESSKSDGDIEIIEGLKLDLNSDDEIKLNVNLSSIQNVFEGRGKNNNKKLLQRILPMFILPFLIQSAIVPMFLSTLKMMLLKSMMVGKLALLLIGINALRTSNAFKSRGEERLADLHYGYHGAGMEEYGSYINGRGL